MQLVARLGIEMDEYLQSIGYEPYFMPLIRAGMATKANLNNVVGFAYKQQSTLV